MKTAKTILIISLLVSSFAIAKPLKYVTSSADTLDANQVLVEASLFFEAYKNKQYEMWTIEKGFNVVNNDPNFQNNKYKIGINTPSKYYWKLLKRNGNNSTNYF